MPLRVLAPISFSLTRWSTRCPPFQAGVVFFFVLACSRMHEPVIAPPSAETLQAVEAQYRTALCQRLLDCGEVSGQESCERYFQWQSWVSFTGPSHVAFQRGRRIVFDAGNAEQCFAAIRQGSCLALPGDLDNFAFSTLELKECRETFKGTVREAEACQGGECEPGTFCSSEAGSWDCFGTCIRRVPAGGSVWRYPDRCEEGLIVSNSICYTPRREGESCLSQHGHGYGCEQGLYCNSSVICERRKPEGAACERSEVCMPPFYCDGGHCLWPRLLRLDEENCSVRDCLLDLTCSYGNQCVERPLEGQSCRLVRCARALRCDAGMVCRKHVVAGEPCRTNVAESDCDVQLFCDSDRLCKPAKPPGATCGGPLECLSRLCQCTIEAASFDECAPRCTTPQLFCNVTSESLN